MRPTRSSFLAASLGAVVIASAASFVAPSSAHAIAVTLRERSSARSSTMPTAAAERTNVFLCTQPETYTFTLTGLTQGLTLSIWRGASCNTLESRRDTAQCERVGNADEILTTTLELPVTANELFDCTDTDAGTKTIWFLVDESSDPDEDATDFDSIELGYDFSVPPTVTGSVSASAAETTASLSWDAPASSDIDGYVILVEDLGAGTADCAPVMLTEGDPITESEIDDLESSEEVGQTAESGEVSGLTVDHTYAIAVVTRDEAGNYGDISAVDCVTTEPVTDFWEAYRGAGGQAEECAVAAPGLRSKSGWALAMIASLVIATVMWRAARKSRARKRIATIVGSALLLGGFVIAAQPSSASAQMRMLRESPQRFALNLRFGPYYPDVDSELGGSGGPFSTYFGDGARLLGGVEFDIDAVIIPYVGRAGVGLGFAGTHFGGNARTAENEASSESTGLTVLPMWVTAFIRVDALPRLVSVPLVFTARIGIENDIWLVDSSDDPSGTTFGFRWALAAWLELDMFERRAARAMDENYGINHSYVTFDVWGAEMDGFGDGSSLVLSDVSWTLGIGFAM